MSLVQRRIISGVVAASVVVFAFVVCCASAPIAAEQMMRRGCCTKHCRMVPLAQPSFFITPIIHGVERPVVPQITPHLVPSNVARIDVASPPLFAPLETIQLRI